MDDNASLRRNLEEIARVCTRRVLSLFSDRCRRVFFLNCTENITDSVRKYGQIRRFEDRRKTAYVF